MFVSIARFIIVIIISFTLTACSFLQQDDLPHPEANCRSALDWNGIVPGQSTEQDVLDVFGEPDEKGEEQKGRDRMSFYAYDVPTGIIADYAQDKVFFRPDGVVDWIEIVVADRNGHFVGVSETFDLLGDVLDNAYMNYSGDIVGPDQLYIWSECGLVLDTIPVCSPTADGGLTCSMEEFTDRLTEPISTTLQFRYQVKDGIHSPVLSVDNIVLMKFLFPPTSYEGYLEFYEEKIPYGPALWNPYFREIQPSE